VWFVRIISCNWRYATFATASFRLLFNPLSRFFYVNAFCPDKLSRLSLVSGYSFDNAISVFTWTSNSKIKFRLGSQVTTYHCNVHNEHEVGCSLLWQWLYLPSPKRRKHSHTVDLAILVRNELRTADLSARRSLQTSLFILYLC